MKTRVRVSTNVTGFTTVTVTVTRDGITAVKAQRLSASQISTGVVELKAQTIAVLEKIERALA